MATFLNDYIHGVDEKWQEIDILINNAKRIEDNDENLYNAICRSITVLLVAHLEGFAKDLVKNVIRDLNQYCDFSALPAAIKRTYCTKYLGNNYEKNRNYEKYMSKLIEKFEQTNCRISDEPFFYSKNKNPTGVSEMIANRSPIASYDGALAGHSL